MSDDMLMWVAAGGVFAAFFVFKRLGQVSPARAKELVQAGATLLDVRTAAEFSSGHLPGAINVPVGEVGARLSKLKQGKPVVVYCASGTRSAMARAVLARHGFEAHNLGGMHRWPAA